jgi:hypothetical protein
MVRSNIFKEGVRGPSHYILRRPAPKVIMLSYKNHIVHFFYK